MMGNRLPAPGAGFVWADGPVPALRPSDGRPAVFTTRLGGASPAPFDSLNLSFVVGDEDARVRANRSTAGALIDAGGEWSVVRQVHGGDVVHAVPPGLLRDADALWTSDADVTMAVLTADCVPVLLAGDAGVAAAHAGWRGLLAGVVEAAARAVGAHTAWIGPAIGPCCYEVGDDVRTPFARRFGPDVLTASGTADLWAAAGAAAADGGASDVHTAQLCTSCNGDLFFSHRRDAGRTGRQALIARTP
jgi:polyphenol oxidase